MLVEVKFGRRVGVIGVLDIFRMYFGVVDLKDIKNNFNYSTLCINVKEPVSGNYERILSIVHSKLRSIYGDVIINTEVNDEEDTDESLSNSDKFYNEPIKFQYTQKIVPPFPNIYDNNGSIGEAKVEDGKDEYDEGYCSECDDDPDSIFYTKETKPLDIELVRDAICYDRLDTLFKLYPVESNIYTYRMLYAIIACTTSDDMYDEFLKIISEHVSDFIKENINLAKEIL